MIPLSILDLSPVTTATSGAAALRNTLDLARLADKFGFSRYWLAEHHNAPSVASTAPDIMIGQVAAVTQRLRVGSGGVMLPNHAPLMVAERFKVLAALFPGRVDLGIGRARGADPVTSLALGRRQDIVEDDFVRRLDELILLETREFPEEHPLYTVHAMPADVPLPPIWLLGSSGHSAELAATAGTGFAFAHHFAKYDAATAIRAYRAEFRPSRWRARPYAILSVHVVCANTDAEAERLAATCDLNYIRSFRGEFLPLAAPDEAARVVYTEIEREGIRENRERMFVGSPETVHDRLIRLIERTQSDELMVISTIYDHGARRRSYELMAECFGLTTFAR